MIVSWSNQRKKNCIYSFERETELNKVTPRLPMVIGAGRPVSMLMPERKRTILRMILFHSSARRDSNPIIVIAIKPRKENVSVCFSPLWVTNSKNVGQSPDHEFLLIESEYPIEFKYLIIVPIVPLAPFSILLTACWDNPVIRLISF